MGEEDKLIIPKRESLSGGFHFEEIERLCDLL